MNLRNKIKVLFVSLLSLLMVEQSFAQKTDSSIVNLGYGITQSSDELSAAVGRL